MKIRDQGVVRNKSVYIALGVTVQGNKEVLGLWIEPTEGAKFWLKVVNELKTRGIQDVLILCCDGLKGFEAPLAVPGNVHLVLGDARCRMVLAANPRSCGWFSLPLPSLLLARVGEHLQLTMPAAMFVARMPRTSDR